ncbi:MAG: DUF1934 domain-containing protein [Clostridiales bacterium]|nr:DUF1934 domain-containing protein [Clostridiales bacterium]
MSKNVEWSRKMQACQIEITSTVDGKQTVFSQKGYCVLAPLSATLQYTEHNAKVTLELKNGVVNIHRIGEYSLSLLLKKGETCDGTLGISGYEGNVQTKTTKLAYSLSETALLLSLHYELIFGEEKQEMKLRIFTKLCE